MQQAKPWYASKTIWVQLVSLIVVAVQAKWGWVIPPEYQVILLGAINVLLRKVTKTEIVWSSGQGGFARLRTMLSLVMASSLFLLLLNAQGCASATKKANVVAFETLTLTYDTTAKTLVTLHDENIISDADYNKAREMYRLAVDAWDTLQKAELALMDAEPGTPAYSAALKIVADAQVDARRLWNDVNLFIISKQKEVSQ